MGILLSKKKDSTGFMDVLFSSTQKKVLSLFFGQPQRKYFSAELIALAESGSGAVQRELIKLTDSGLIKTEKIGLTKFYQANPEAPIYEELCQIFAKTSGIQGLILNALKRIESQIDIALIFGSTARRSDKATSDVDLLIVSDNITLEKIYECLEETEELIKRKISPVIYSRSEFAKKQNAPNSFIDKILHAPHIVLIGDTHGT